MGSSTKTHNILKGSLFAIIAFFAMAVFGVFTKMGYEVGGPLWLSFMTYLIATLFTTIWILPKGFTYLRSNHYGYLILRAVIGTAASFLYMLSMNYIPIVNSTLLFNTAPIFIPLLSIVWLKLHIHTTIWFAVILGFIGILIIIKPSASSLITPGNLIGLLSGIALAIAYLTMKLLTDTDPGLRIIFYYVFIGTIMQIPLLWFAKTSLSSATFFYAFLSGVMLLIAQLSLVKAYTYAEASEVGVYQYTSIIFVALIEWFFWGKNPSLSDFIGFVFVSIAGVIIIRSGIKAKKLVQIQGE